MTNGVVTIPLPGQPLSDNGSSPDDNRTPLAMEFIAGPENCLVEPAVLGILGRRLTPFNPLVLYGPSGTGKSHLARGIAATWKANFPHSRVVYTTAVDFARERKDAFDAQSVEDFRARYPGAALAVFEDLGELAADPVAPGGSQGFTIATQRILANPPAQRLLPGRSRGVDLHAGCDHPARRSGAGDHCGGTARHRRLGPSPAKPAGGGSLPAAGIAGCGRPPGDPAGAGPHCGNSSWPTRSSSCWPKGWRGRCRSF